MGKKTRSVPAAQEYKPSLSVKGAMAKKLHNLKPGSKVTLTITGTVTETGINTYNDRQPTARLEVSRITTPRRKK